MAQAPSIAAAVREVVERDPCLWYCIQEGIVNLTALARLVASRVGELTGSRPSISAVKMALSRLSRSRRPEGRLAAVARVLAGSSLVLQDKVAVVTTGREALRRLFAAGERVWRARFLQVSQSIGTATVVVSEEDLDVILSVLGGGEVVREQAALIMVSPPEIVETPGVVALITGYLNYHGINITQIISCATDTIIVLDSTRAPEAFRALHSLTHSMRALVGEESRGAAGEASEG